MSHNVESASTLCCQLAVPLNTVTFEGIAIFLLFFTMSCVTLPALVFPSNSFLFHPAVSTSVFLVFWSPEISVPLLNAL